MLYFRYAMGEELMRMAGIIPKKKLSKKAQKELNSQRRVLWDFSPVTRKVDSKKLYNRKRIARDRRDDGTGDSYFVLHAYSASKTMVTDAETMSLAA